MRKKICIAIIIGIIITIAFMSSTSIATINPGDYKNVSGTLSGDDKISQIGGYVFNAVAVVGSGIAIISITILGIKYMVSSVEDKAQVKKKLVPFVIGAAIFFGASFVMRIIFDIVSWFNF